MFLYPLASSLTPWTGGTNAVASTRRIRIDRRRFFRNASMFLFGWIWRG